nr:MAG TPA: hypothetical protein [Caudoviricetes sp.]
MAVGGGCFLWCLCAVLWGLVCIYFRLCRSFDVCR